MCLFQAAKFVWHNIIGDIHVLSSEKKLLIAACMLVSQDKCQVVRSPINRNGPCPLLISLLLPLASTQAAYHIKPTAESPCICHPLRLCVRNQTTGQTTWHWCSFLVSTLSTISSSPRADLGNLKLLGSTSFHHNVTTIQCIRDSGIILKNITIAEIAELCFLNCGNISDPTLSTLRIPRFHLVSCRFEDNYLPLLSDGCNVLLQDDRFEQNKIGAVLAISSYILLKGYNLFRNAGA